MGCIRSEVGVALALPILGIPGGVADAAASVTPMCHGQTATIVGTSGVDDIEGTKGPDVIIGLGGSDLIHGYGGDDTICAGSGDRDRVWGGDGDDWIGHLQEGGRYRLKGERGDDVIVAGPAIAGAYLLPRVLGGGAGDDILRGGPDQDFLAGGPGSDRIWGNGGGDEIYDVLTGSSDQLISAGPDWGGLIVGIREPEGFHVKTDGQAGTFTFADLDVTFPIHNFRSITMSSSEVGTWTARGTEFNDFYEVEEFAPKRLRVIARMRGGNDTVYSAKYDDKVFGGPGRDEAYVGAGSDICIGVEITRGCETER